MGDATADIRRVNGGDGLAARGWDEFIVDEEARGLGVRHSVGSCELN